MKEIVCTVKQTFLVNWNEIVTYGLFAAGGGIFGMIMMLVLLACGGMEGEYIHFGSIAAIMFGIIVLIFLGVFSLKNDFNLAISMGKTRKYFVPARYLLFIADCLVCGIVAMLIGRVEDAIYKAFYPEVICGLNTDALFGNPVCWVCILVVLPVALVLSGGLYLKFSGKFFWIFWGVWMLSWLGIPRMLSASEKSPDSLPGKMGTGVLQFFQRISGAQAATALLGFLIVSVTVIVLVFRRQRVTA